jgi:hypothetical protein
MLRRVILVSVLLGSLLFFSQSFVKQGHAANNVSPLPLISQNVPAYSNDPCYSPSWANDADYQTQWRGCNTPSASNPTWLAYDMSHSLNDGAPGKVLVIWYNDPQSTVDSTWEPTSEYNNIAAFTIEGNAAPSGGSAPTSGWVVLNDLTNNQPINITGNTLNTRQFLTDMTGYNWIRINVTAPLGTSGNMGVGLNMDVHDASQVAAGSLPQDDWAFLGDSITAQGMNHDPQNGTGTFSQLISQSLPGYFPVEQDFGLGGANASTGVQYINKFLSMFPGKYVALSFGTNDANGGCNATSLNQFYANYSSMINSVLAVGKVPVIPHIPWGRTSNIQTCGPQYNAQIDALFSDPNFGSQLIHGPDLWAFFQANQSLISSDGIHPTLYAGYIPYRQQWVNAMLATIYGNSSPTNTPTPTVTPTPTGMQTPTPTVIPTSTPTPTDTPTPTQILTPTPTGISGSVSLVGTGTAHGNFGAGIKIKIPAIQAGDLLIAVAGTNGKPVSWTKPTGWTMGANSAHPDGQGLNWFWKIATNADSGANVTLKAASYADGGGIVLAYRGTASNPIVAVSTMATNDNNGNGNVKTPTINGVSWSQASKVVDLLLTSWQPSTSTVSWPSGFTQQETATDGFGFVMAAANLNSAVTSNFSARTATFSTGEAVIPTLQIALLSN